MSKRISKLFHCVWLRFYSVPSFSESGFNSFSWGPKSGAALLYTAQVHCSSRGDFSCQLPQPRVATLTYNISLPSLLSLQCTVGFQMRCILPHTPATTDTLCGIKWAEFILRVCYTQFWCVSFPSEWQMRWKISTSKTRPLKALTLLSSTVVSKLKTAAWRDIMSQSGRFGLSRNSHILCRASFSIISTSWAPFPLMCFSEGNHLWQFYLFHCMAGLFLENHF